MAVILVWVALAAAQSPGEDSTGACWDYGTLFRRVGPEWGVRAYGRSLGVNLSDFDGDGRTDIYVTWASDAHGSIVWAILFLHTYDIVADLIMTAVLILILALGKYGEKQRVAVHVDSVLYYFLVGMWFPLYAVVYWGPRMVGGAR